LTHHRQDGISSATGTDARSWGGTSTGRTRLSRTVAGSRDCGRIRVAHRAASHTGLSRPSIRYSLLRTTATIARVVVGIRVTGRIITRPHRGNTGLAARSFCGDTVLYVPLIVTTSQPESILSSRIQLRPSRGDGCFANLARQSCAFLQGTGSELWNGLPGSFRSLSASE